MNSIIVFIKDQSQVQNKHTQRLKLSSQARLMWRYIRTNLLSPNLSLLWWKSDCSSALNYTSQVIFFNILDNVITMSSYHGVFCSYMQNILEICLSSILYNYRNLALKIQILKQFWLIKNYSGLNLTSWWWTGRPGMLQFMGSQRVRHDWVTELNWNFTSNVVI